MSTLTVMEQPVARQAPSPAPAHRRPGLFGKLRHRNDIQGLRAVAVLLVVLDHAGVPHLKGGYVGVDVFFVLSGFLITGLLLSGGRGERQGRLAKIGEFYARRARRILPAAGLTLLTTGVAAYYLLNFVRAKQVLLDSISAALFFANVHFAAQGTNYFQQGQPPSPIQHFWSLSVEEQFYLVWPAVLVIVLFGVSFALRHRSYSPRPPVATPSRRRVQVLTAAISLVLGASLAWSIYYTHHLPAAAYFSTFARAWELALGALLAIVAPRLAHLGAGLRAPAGWLGLACILVAAAMFSAGTAFPGYAALLPCLGAALVIAAGINEKTGRWEAGRLLATGPFRYIGDRSYTLYLWHWPLLILAAEYEGHSLSLGVNLGIVAAALLLSILTYRFFENPIRRAEWASPLKPLILWPITVLIVLVVAGLAVNSIDNREVALKVASQSASSVADTGAAQAQNAQIAKVLQAASTTADSRALPAVVSAVGAANRGAPLPSALTPSAGELLHSEYMFPPGCAAEGATQTSSNLCHLGAAGAKQTMVVFGDSHAQMWMPAILGMAQQTGWAVIPVVKQGCESPKLLPASYGTPSWLAPGPYCQSWYKWALGQIQALHPTTILIGTDYGGFQGSAAQAVLAAIDRITATFRRYSRHVVLIADVDGITQDPTNCLLAPQATMRTCTETVDPARFALNDQLAQISAASRAFGLIKTRGWFCYRGQCPMVIGNTVVYQDSQGHITSAYAQEMTKAFGSAFQLAAR